MISVIKEFFKFIFSQKKYWLFPVVLVLIILSILLVWAPGSAVAPFIYTIF